MYLGARMSEIKNKPALPHNTVYPDNAFEEHSGLSMRDYFAAKAMQTMMDKYVEWGYDGYDDLAKDAYSLADAMLAEREKSGDD